MAGDRVGDGKLSFQAECCVKAFNPLCFQEAEVEASWAEDQRARFQDWSAGLGIFTPGRASIDYLLREDEDALDLFLKLLQGLEANVIFLQAHVVPSQIATIDEFNLWSRDPMLTTNPAVSNVGSLKATPQSASEIKGNVESIISTLIALTRTVHISRDGEVYEAASNLVKTSHAASDAAHSKDPYSFEPASRNLPAKAETSAPRDIAPYSLGENARHQLRLRVDFKEAGSTRILPEPETPSHSPTSESQSWALPDFLVPHDSTYHDTPLVPLISRPKSQNSLATSETSEAGLEARLWDARIEWPGRGSRYFIPASDLQRLINIKSIKAELSNGLKNHEFLSKILSDAPRLFGVLVCLGLSETIADFLQDGFKDDDLPFVRFVSVKKSAAMLCSHRRMDKPIQAMKRWSRASIENFVNYQWWMLAPIFRTSDGIVRHLVLDDNCVLPFIEDHERDDATQGGFSSVWKIKIHPAHQFLYHEKTSNDSNPMLALKKLYSNEEKDFKTEVEMLKAFSRIRHAHLIKLLATFEFQGRYYLVFPLALGNLREYWSHIETPEFSFSALMWSIKQLKGIASGLMAIHEYQPSGSRTNDDVSSGQPRYGSPEQGSARTQGLYGRHGDIKPENILWMDQTSKEDSADSHFEALVLADFGLMDFHRKKTRSLVAPNSIGGSPTYEPPGRMRGQKISRGYDIWSLGCVYLEHLTWILAGYEKLREFPEARGLDHYDGIDDDCFYRLVFENGSKTPEAVVRESVVDWIYDLHEMPRCSEFFHDLLYIISTDMLVVDTRHRAHIGILNHKMLRMLEKAEENPSYLMQPCPHSPRGKKTAPQTGGSTVKNSPPPLPIPRKKTPTNTGQYFQLWTSYKGPGTSVPKMNSKSRRSLETRVGSSVITTTLIVGSRNPRNRILPLLSSFFGSNFVLKYRIDQWEVATPRPLTEKEIASLNHVPGT